MSQRDMSFFMLGITQGAVEEEVHISKRFKDNSGNVIPFVMKAISTEELDELQKECTTKEFKKGKQTTKFNQSEYLTKVGIRTTIYPDFKNADLLKGYGVVDPVDVVKKVLSIGGEYVEWMNAVNRINGFEEDFEELVEDAKN